MLCSAYYYCQVRSDRPGHRPHLRQGGLHRPAGRVQAEAVQIAAAVFSATLKRLGFLVQTCIFCGVQTKHLLPSCGEIMKILSCLSCVWMDILMFYQLLKRVPLLLTGRRYGRWFKNGQFHLMLMSQPLNIALSFNCVTKKERTNR